MILLSTKDESVSSSSFWTSAECHMVPHKAFGSVPARFSARVYALVVVASLLVGTVVTCITLDSEAFLVWITLNAIRYDTMRYNTI